MVTQAIVDIYEDSQAASIRANRLRERGWQVVMSGPDEGVDIHDAGGPPEQRNGTWVVLASKEAIAPA